MKKILVPTDFSECAKASEKYAEFLAKKTGAELLYLHIIHTPVDWSKLSKDQEHLFPEIMESIAKAKESLKSRIKVAESMGITAAKLLIFNNTNEKIHRYAEDENIDLVVMGSHGQYGFRDHIIGTNTYSMLRRSKMPVVVVKNEMENPKLETLVFATNFQSEMGKSFEKIEHLAEELKVKLHILYVNTPNNFKGTYDIINQGKSFLKEYSNYNYDIHIVDSLSVERGIIQFLKHGEYDGIAAITEGKSDFAQYFSPSITENLISMSNKPIISLKASGK